MNNAPRNPLFIEMKKLHEEESKRLKKLAGIEEEEHNFLPEPNVIDDLPSVKLDMDDEGVMRIQVSAFFHGPENGKTPLLANNKVLQDLLMKAIQQESQNAFRRAVHSVLGIPYGLD